jgi:hypothetical protein
LFRILIIFAFLFSKLDLVSQDENKPAFIGAGLEFFYSVNGHGSFFSPHVSYNKNKHHLKLGPCIHKRSLKVKGAKLTYSYMLVGMDAEEQFNTNFKESSNASWRVSIFAYGQFVDYTSLSINRAEEETLLNEGSGIDWYKVNISTAEGGVGAELDVKLFNYLQFRTYVGLTVYSHLNQPQGMYQDQTAAAFIAGVGLNIPSFKKSDKKSE